MLSVFSISLLYIEQWLVIFYSFFFFQSSGDHRDLHSFPTRRSSDLAHARVHGGNLRGVLHRELPNGRADLRRITVQNRSEEHTSELQSPVHLVCRLLLEKKKKTYPYSPYSQSDTFASRSRYIRS